MPFNMSMDALVEQHHANIMQTCKVLLHDLHWLPVVALQGRELYPSTSKHWSDHTPQQEHFALLRQLAGSFPRHWEQIKPAQWSRDYSMYWHLSGGTHSWPMSGQWNHSPSTTKTQDSFVHTSPWPRIASLPPNPPKKRYALVLSLALLS